jgi:hypothetical protein
MQFVTYIVAADMTISPGAPTVDVLYDPNNSMTAAFFGFISATNGLNGAPGPAGFTVTWSSSYASLLSLNAGSDGYYQLDGYFLTCNAADSQSVCLANGKKEPFVLRISSGGSNPPNPPVNLESLPYLNADFSTVTVSGHSAGCQWSQTMQVVHSDTIKGSTLVQCGPYGTDLPDFHAPGASTSSLLAQANAALND